jgi:predicted methyltransferase
MRTVSLGVIGSVFVFALGCGSVVPDAPPGVPINPPQKNDDLLAMMTGDTAGPSHSGPPSAEDPKKAEDQRKLAEDFAKLNASISTEKARMTDQVRKEIADLSAKDYGSFKAAVQAALKSSHRTPGAADRDKYRHPVETLTFFGLRMDMNVLELDAGGGWYTELLAPVLRKKGKLSVTAPDPNGPMTERPTLYGKTLRAFLDKSPELGDKVGYVAVDPEKGLAFNNADVYDAALAIRTMHGWHRRGVLDKNIGEVFKALKPGGVFGVVQHRAKEGADPKESAEKGYLPQAFVIERAQAAGFKLEAKSEVNANPKDTKDHPDGVWSLPPSYRGGDKDKDKFKAIGESDRMTLKFVKPATKAVAAPKAPDAKPAPKAADAAKPPEMKPAAKPPAP